MRVKYESVPHEQRGTVTCRDFDLPAFDCPYHMHQELEIVRIDASEGQVLVGDHAGAFTPGQIYVFGSKLPHAFLNRPGTACARSRCIQLTPDPLEGLGRLFPEAVPMTSLLRRADRGLLVDKTALQQASSALDAVFEAMGFERLLRTLELIAWVAAEANSLPLASPAYSPVESSRQVARLESVLSHIHTNCTEAINIQHLARLAAMSSTSFHRFFKQSLGRTPVAYINELRLANVAHRLLESNDSVAEIAFAEGFNNLSNFNRLFKRRFGSSPREYRQLVNPPADPGQHH